MPEYLTDFMCQLWMFWDLAMKRLRGLSTICKSRWGWIVFYDKLGTVAMRLQVSPTVNGVGEALSRLALRQFELDEDIEAYPCRLCNSGFLDEADLHEHVKEKHAASYANDPQRAFVEYRKKVLGLVMAGGPQAG